jgi:hypothetical protein
MVITLAEFSILFNQSLTFKPLGCQPEPVEGGFILMHRVRQAHPDNILKIEQQ